MRTGATSPNREQAVDLSSESYISQGVSKSVVGSTEY